MYVYIRTDGNQLFTVGFYKPDGVWVPESDWSHQELAAARVAWLNGAPVRVDLLEIVKLHGRN